MRKRAVLKTSHAGRKKRASKRDLAIEPNELSKVLTENKMGDCILDLDGLNGRRIILKTKDLEDGISFRWDEIQKVLDIATTGIEGRLAILPVVYNRVELKILLNR